MLEENRKLLSSFVSNMQSSGKSANTIKNYKREIKQFLEFIGDKKFEELAFADCEDFQNYLNSNGNSAGTILHKRSALSTFTKYVMRRDEGKSGLENKFVLMDKLPKSRVRPLIIWDKGKILSTVDYFADKDVRISTLLALALYSGRRASELTRFKVSDFDDSRLIGDGKFWVTDEIETKGRGDHKMQCFILTGFRPYLERWLEKRPTESEWLFPVTKDASRHISSETMKNLAKRIKKVPQYKEFHWHMARHTIVTTMLDAGVPADIVVKIIGWADAKMLAVYDDRDKVNVIDKYFKDNKEMMM